MKPQQLSLQLSLLSACQLATVGTRRTWHVLDFSSAQDDGQGEQRAMISDRNALPHHRPAGSAPLSSCGRRDGGTGNGQRSSSFPTSAEPGAKGPLSLFAVAVSADCGERTPFPSPIEESTVASLERPLCYLRAQQRY